MANGKTDNTPETLCVGCLMAGSELPSGGKCRSCKGLAISVRNRMPDERRAVDLPARLAMRPG